MLLLLLLLLLLRPTTLMFPPRTLILLWWCHPYGRCVMAVMQPHLPTFSLVPFGRSRFRISSCLFPDVQSILHRRCFYPLLRWKRWMSLFHCSSLATASSPLAHSLPSSLSLYCLLSPFPLISLSLSTQPLLHVCFPTLALIVLCCSHTLSSLPPSLPVLLSPPAVSSGPYLSHFPAFFLVAQGEQPLLSAPESSRWWFGRIMHLGRVDSRLLITPFCTLLQYFNVLRLVTKSIWLTTEPVVMLSSELMP